MSRHSSIRADRIDYALWLIFDEKGNARMSRGMPGFNRNERGMRLEVSVPRALFRTPQLSANIQIADPGPHLPQIDVAASEAALKAVIGCDVQITVSTPE